MRLSALILCLTCSIALAQPMPDLATDQEILAGYCLGKSKQERINFGSMVDPSAEAPFLDEVKARIARFYFYLVARGVFSGGRSAQAINGIVTAWKRGAADENSCNASRGTGPLCKSVARCYDLYP